MQNAVDMSLIREAIQRRQQGGGGLGRTSSQPTRQLPSGASANPMPAPPQISPVQGLPQPQGQPQAQGQSKQESANIDEQTRAMTKQLINRLMKYI